MKNQLKNPFLSKYRSYFELAFQTYLGGKDYINQQLVQHLGEEVTHYQKRLDLAHNINVIDKIINILSSFVVGNVDRVIELEDDVRKEYETMIDLEQSLEEFLERKVADFLLMDNAFTFVDSDGSRAYCHDLNYLDLYDFKRDMGRIEYLDIAFDEKVVRISKDRFQFTTEEKYFEDKGPKFNDEKDNELGILPFVSVNAKLDVRTAYFRDAVYIQKAVFNHYGNISQQLLDTGNTILAIPGSDAGSNSAKMNMQTSRVIRFMPSSPVLPHYISPDTSHLEFYLKYIIHIIEQLLNSLNIYRESNGNSQTSGLSKSYDYSIMANFLSKLAGKMERFERDMWDMIAKYDSRVKPEKIEVKYRKDFDLKTLAEQLDNVLRISSLQISETLSKEMEKKLAARFVENDDTLKQIYKEIDSKNYAVTVRDELDSIDKQI